jgi:hypothetical protein
MLSRTPSRRPPGRSAAAGWGPALEIRNAEAWRYQWHEELLKRHDLSRAELAVAGVLMHRCWSDRGYAEVGLGLLRAPRKIDFVANRGLSWSERLRIGTRTNRNHSTTILWRAIGSGYFSRCPKVRVDRATKIGANAAPSIPWRLHDLRRTGVSTLARLGYDSIVVDKLLAHQPGKLRGVAAVYQRHDFAKERAQALDAWAVHVVPATVASNVVRLTLTG